MITRLFNAQVAAMLMWHFYADLEADRLVAERYGVSTVGRWVQRHCLAGGVIPTFLTGTVAPTARAGILLPVAESCREALERADEPWTARIEAQTGKAVSLGTVTGGAERTITLGTKRDAAVLLLRH